MASGNGTSPDLRLTSRDMARFVRDGFLRFDGLVPRDLCAAAMDEIESGRHLRDRGQGGAPFRDIWAASDSALGQAFRLPRVAAIIHSLVGPDPRYDHHDPTGAQIRLYERWAQGGAAVSIIGEVQGDHRYPEKPGNLVFGAHTDQRAIASLVSRAVIDGAHLWPQLGHAGALSHPPISQPKGPSALAIEGLRCAALSGEEIEELPEMYATTAAYAMQAGFSGV